MHDIPDLSVVIPAYNEASRIGPTLDAVSAFLASQMTPYEIIVVSDGSTDSTIQTVNTYAAKNQRIQLTGYSPNRGKGYAVRTGMLQAKANNVLLTDADLATPIEDFVKLQDVARNGCDVVVGSRALEESQVIGWRPWYRVLSGKVFNKIVQLLTVPGIHDTQCGFKLFTNGCAGRIFSLSRIDGFGFDVEILFLAKKLGFRIEETAVRWQNSPSTKVSVVRDTFPMLREVLQVRLNDRKKLYDRPSNNN
ncbi:MAG: glycosyltransferase family 2 protein [Candidatus Abyssobacteria bacterium SURF_5]|uniref:dolichyl-phosphate beta-glucosyltransferase n=1 Tax=Abyssobacteria bacterium (strain SURF_5) TaxID=2093360 RepID=A0A3A4N029_ABYX5|nr:MAG: glycosyltransferase family 2 protein [Candidatus Abyssubacteria bacterium SURF_5]